MIEVNLDDWNPEAFSYLEEKLFETGALDVFRTSIVMKKGRLGVKLSVLCEKAKQGELEAYLYQETPTIGLRAYVVEKSELNRDFVSFTFEGHSFSVKRVYLNDAPLKYKVEFEDLKRVARLTGESLYRLNQRLETALEAEALWKKL